MKGGYGVSGGCQSKSRQHGHFKSSGFTVIELMITLAISAIGLILAVPSYNMLVQKRELTSAAEGIHSLVVFARQEAVKRNEEVTVAWYSPGGHTSGWCIGLSVGSTPCDCTENTVTQCVIDDVPYQLDQDDFARAGPQFFHANPNEAANSFFSFDPIRGILDWDNLPSEVGARIDNDQYIFYVHSDTRNQNDHEGSRWYSLELRLNHTGRLAICADTSRTSIIGGYPECR